jgi:hypothetical protein
MSEIRAATVSNLAGTGPVTLTGQYAAKAWVNFNGTGTVAIRGSGNVSSLTDNGTGDYTVNFSNAFGAADYAVSLASAIPTNTAQTDIISVLTAAARVGVINDNGATVARADSGTVTASTHGDLA